MSKLAASEKELVIRIAEDEAEVTAYATGQKWIRLLKKLADRLGAQGEALSTDVYRVKLPADGLSLLAVKRRVNRT